MSSGRESELQSPLAPAESAAFHQLTNGRYATVVTPAGGGFSAFDDHLLTAWQPDPVEGNGGLLIFLRDLDTGDFWTSSGRPVPGQPAGQITRDCERITIARSHSDLSSRIEVRLHASAGIEQRTCTLTNLSSTPRRIELTSFVEVVLNHPGAHESHPAFSKLFVQTSEHGDGSILIATRRPRGPEERLPALLHALYDAPVTDSVSDRASFIGRGRDLGNPRALTDQAPLGRIHGNVLDPALCLRTVLQLAPGTAHVAHFLLAAGDDASVLLRQVELVRKTGLDAVKLSPHAGDAVRKLVSSLTSGLKPLAQVRTQARPTQPARPAGQPAAPLPDLQFFNGFGGFSRDGREYVMHIARDASNRPQLPPAPWANVIANPDFGCVISETGAGTAWSQNSREHRLTPWSNDPVIDPHGDALYVRDEETGEFWSPMPGPAAPLADFEVRHGLGYSTWRHSVDELEHQVTVFVPETDPLRLARVNIRNAGTRPRRLAVYAYNRWVLGTTTGVTRSSVHVEHSARLQAVLARNVSSPDWSHGIAFAAADRVPLDGWCGDRSAFLGMPGSPAAPAALVGDGRLPEVSGDDPCAVMRIVLDVAPGASREVTFLLGEARSESELSTLLEMYRRPGQIDAALHRARSLWEQMLARLQIETPSAALNVMVNGWLPYQDIACRMWARSAFYQSGGAFGFRDQIQDATALIHLRPDLTRAQILLHAGHQFVEGDVLHWWHPPRSRGLRTRFADDLLWLPWATAYYVRVTGDRKLLDERARYVEARALEEGEAEAFIVPKASAFSGDVYEHCCRAIDRSLARGAHGLPLFGAGDWNDGMNRVGVAGRGESVWMGFFLYSVLGDFLALCVVRGDAERATRYREHRDELFAALNSEGWDGAWYRRGWYDNGAVLGSHMSDECRIDALVQSWAVVSRGAPAERIELALDSLEEHLVDDEEQLIRLLTPPFVNTPDDPGYIKGYVAGVRENGGQYTHAATWVVRAMAEAGRRDRALELMEALLPINHSLDAAAARKYKVEPYVVAADVYGAEPHIGRGGWTWYTGSAGWMYRVAIETILGFSIENGDTLRLQPRIPDTWPGFRLDYQLGDGTKLRIEVSNPGRRAARIVSARLDDAELAVAKDTLRLPLTRTGRAHTLNVVLGE